MYIYILYVYLFIVKLIKFVSLKFRLKITYIGKASHAAGFPWDGVNALDAAVMAYTSISVLRQQMKPDWRIHGVYCVLFIFLLLYHLFYNIGYSRK